MEPNQEEMRRFMEDLHRKATEKAGISRLPPHTHFPGHNLTEENKRRILAADGNVRFTAANTCTECMEWAEKLRQAFKELMEPDEKGEIGIRLPEQ
jgi:hypothetical protein